MKCADLNGFICTASIEVVNPGAKIHLYIDFRLNFSLFNSILLAFAVRQSMISSTKVGSLTSTEKGCHFLES